MNATVSPTGSIAAVLTLASSLEPFTPSSSSIDPDSTPIILDDEPLIFLCGECKIVAVCLYTLLSIVAFVGNSLVVAVIVHFRRLHTPTNMLIVNLAVADLMISIFCMPLSYWHVIIFEGRFLLFFVKKLIPPFQINAGSSAHFSANSSTSSKRLRSF
jgi:hypothetical protein